VRNETWLEELACELRAAGVAPADVAGVIVELQGHLDDSAQSALASFGAPQAYAAQVSSAIGAGAGPRRTAGPVRVKAHRIAKSYKRRCVLRDVDLEVRAGDVTALIGPNGCGKSTLLRVLAGLEVPDEGSVSVDGAIGYVPQRGGLAPYLRPQEHFELFGAARGMSAGAARREGDRLAGELGWDAAAAPIARDLSGGTSQKLSLTLALLGDPEVLLLDEPNEGLDLDSTQRFWELLWDRGEQGAAALVVSHTGDALSRAAQVVELPLVVPSWA
jgi:ABC-2 type transport system ATP-binding protein